MQEDVITITPETPILDVHRLFVEEEIHGAPVVDEDGLVIGVISTLDVLRVVRDQLDPGAGATTPMYFRDQLLYSGPDWQRMPEDFQDRMQETTAADAMTKELVTAGPETPAADLARTMAEQHIHRVLITDDGALLGIVTTFDLLRVVHGDTARTPVGANTRKTGYSR
jgi:CBS domain-containing protein